MEGRNSLTHGDESVDMIFRRPLGILLLSVVAPLLLHSADGPAPPSLRPPYLISADQDEVKGHILLKGPFPSQPEATDFAAGLLISQIPNLIAQPKIELTDVVPTRGGDYTVDLKIEALMPFGESSVPLLYQGAQIDLLRFLRPGVTVSPADGATFIARQSYPLLLILDNHSSFAYSQVRARLRFQDHDLCEFEVEGSKKKPSNKNLEDCSTESKWQTFGLPQYAHVTLRALDLPAEWFQDPTSGYARNGKSSGTFTLHFTSPSNGTPSAVIPKIHEEDVPLEVQFEPSNGALGWTLVKIFSLLVLGASLSFLLRVSLPNMKRKRTLKDQLAEAHRLIAGLSSEVDSRLRTLLGSECLALDELRKQTFPIAPNYAEYAKRAEQGLPILSRKIAVAKRLGSALERQQILINSGHEYRILAESAALLNNISRLIQKDQITDADWLFVTQTLAKAESMLEEPSQQVQDSFESELTGRWEALRDHFAPRDANGALAKGLWAPTAPLKDVQALFDSLPKEFCAEDVEGFKRWMKHGASTEGDGPADVLVSALELLLYVETIVPPGSPSTDWKREKDYLFEILLNPTTQKLFEAKEVMWRLADNVFKTDITKALEGGHAKLVVDPENPSTSQRFRISVRLLDQHLNTATARDQLECCWTLRTTFGRRRLLTLWGRDDVVKIRHEWGWHAFHYFESGSMSTEISVAFSSGSDSVNLTNNSGNDFPSITVTPTVSLRGKEKYARTVLELAQLAAALLIPLAALATSTVNGGGDARWWTLAGLGFGTDTIKNIILGKDDTAAPPPT